MAEFTDLIEALADTLLFAAAFVACWVWRKNHAEKTEAARERDLMYAKLEEKQLGAHPDPNETLDDFARDVADAQLSPINDWLTTSPDAAGFDENQQEHARWAYAALLGSTQTTHEERAEAHELLTRWGAPRPE
jgi:hypothetical protein